MKKAVFALLSLIIIFKAKAQLLYKCESPHKDTVTWVLATMHIMEAQLYNADPLLDSVITWSKVIFVEPLIDDGTNTHFRSALLNARKSIFYEDGKKLTDFLNADEVAAMESFITAQSGISIKQLRKNYSIIPFFMLYNVPQIRDAKMVRLDNIVIDKSQKLKKKLVALDNVDSIGNTYRLLREVYTPEWLKKNYINTWNDAVKTRIAYTLQDTSFFHHYTTPEDERSYGFLIRDRNNKWKKIIDSKSTTSNFIAAGLTHIISYNDGLLDFYKNKGYTITPVTLKITKSN